VTTIANHRVYNGFGVLESQTNAAVDSLFGYTGRPFDNATGLQNNNARWYEAITGRWLSEDPSKFKAGDANLNRYVGNSPMNRRDPTGLDDGGGMVNMSRPSSGFGSVSGHGAPGASGSGGGGGAGGGGGCGCGGYAVITAYDAEDIDGGGPSEGDPNIFLVPLCVNGCGGSYAGGGGGEGKGSGGSGTDGWLWAPDVTLVGIPGAPPGANSIATPAPSVAPGVGGKSSKRNPASSGDGPCIGEGKPDPKPGTLEWADIVMKRWLTDQQQLPKDRIFNITSEELRDAAHIKMGTGWLYNTLDYWSNPAYTGDVEFNKVLDFLNPYPEEVAPKPVGPPVDHPHCR
jgi:RHS repeat-associated protein